RFALTLDRDRGERVAPAARVVTHVYDTADVFGGDSCRVSDLGQAGQEVPAQHLVALAGLELTRLQAVPQLTREFQAPRCVLERIAAEIAPVDLRIHALGRAAEAGIEIVAEGKLRLGAASGDLGQILFLALRWQRLVGGLDGPGGVRADVSRDVTALRRVL